MGHPQRAKPLELTNLHALAEDLFEVFREAFAVPRVVELTLTDVDGRRDHEQVVAALAMHEIQSLRRAASVGEPVTNVDVVNVAAALHGAIDRLVEHPSARDMEPTLREARDRINQAARVAAALGNGVDGGIVELR